MRVPFDFDTEFRTQPRQRATHFQLVRSAQAGRFVRRIALPALTLLAASNAIFAEPIFQDGFELPLAVEVCAPHPLIEPAGWERQNRTWVSTWSSPDGDPQASYPSGVGFPVPLGAGVQAYRVVEFTPNPAETVVINWDRVQANIGQGYYPPRPADSAWISISPCPGDLRPADDLSADPFLRTGCRRGGSAASMLFSTEPFETNFQACHLEAGTKYYMNVVMANPQDGLSPQETSCPEYDPNTQSRCDVAASHRPQ